MWLARTGSTALLKRAVLCSCFDAGADRVPAFYAETLLPLCRAPWWQPSPVLKRYILTTQGDTAAATAVFYDVLQGLKGFAEGETAGGPTPADSGPAADQSAPAGSMSEDPIIQHVSVPASRCEVEVLRGLGLQAASCPAGLCA